MILHTAGFPLNSNISPSYHAVSYILLKNFKLLRNEKWHVFIVLFPLSVLWIVQWTKLLHFVFLFSEHCLCFFFSCRIGLIVICSLLVCAALYMIKLREGIIAAALCIIIIATIAIQVRESFDFEDITTGFMIRQLIDANSLIADRGKFTFFHGQNHTILEELANVSGTERTLPEWPGISQKESQEDLLK